MGLRIKILSVAVAGFCAFPLAGIAYPQAQPNAAAHSSGSGTAQQIAAIRAKAWNLFYAGKFEAAANAAQPLLKCGQHDVEQEATHLLARCLWSANTPKTRGEAQQLWQQLDKPLAGSANHLRLDIAKALVLDDQPPPKTTEAIELLERDYILQGNSGGTAQAEMAIELAALYAEDGKPDKAGKLLDAIPPFFAGENLVRLELDQADVAPFLNAAAAARVHLNSTPASPGQAEFQRAEALRASGRYQDAFKAYQGIIQKYPDTDFAPHSQLCLGYCLLGKSGGY
jgi:TolA-binding protein